MICIWGKTKIVSRRNKTFLTWVGGDDRSSLSCSISLVCAWLILCVYCWIGLNLSFIISKTRSTLGTPATIFLEEGGTDFFWTMAKGGECSGKGWEALAYCHPLFIRQWATINYSCLNVLYIKKIVWSSNWFLKLQKLHYKNYSLPYKEKLWEKVPILSH